MNQAKLIDWGLRLGNQSLTMLVAIIPEAEQQVGILVQVHAVGQETYLPSNIKLCLLSESDEILQEVQSRSQNYYIRLKRFQGFPGQCFQLQVALNDASIKESFTI